MGLQNDEVNEEHYESLCEMIDYEINKHYEENFIAGLERAKELIKNYFEYE
ncbi:MAG TPA: hypothetical protein VHQ24_16245 [Lachnospiraceae bacterium]|nr:hypothetical protein [Lachnospiraceae bacterium]